MHGLAPRHRRKAGSGPPASALIAWIGADPHLRSAVAAAASRRRETPPPTPANTRTTRAAVIVCFVLASSAVLGTTTIVNDGDPAPGNSTSLALSQSNAAAPDQGAPSVPPIPVTSPTAVDVAPMTVNPRTPQPTPVPPAREHIRSPTPPAHWVSPPRTDKPDGIQPGSGISGDTTESGDTNTSIAHVATGAPPRISAFSRRPMSGRGSISAGEPTSHRAYPSRLPH